MRITGDPMRITMNPIRTTGNLMRNRAGLRGRRRAFTGRVLWHAILRSRLRGILAIANHEISDTGQEATKQTSRLAVPVLLLLP